MSNFGRPVVDLVGRRFGRLVVLRRAVNRKNHQARWYCRCECGDFSIVSGYRLRSGRTKSCGCWKRDTASIVYTEIGKRKMKHGKEPIRLYRIWRNMKQRCFNPADAYFDSYGGRGITVCDEWKSNFIVFRDWSFSHGYTETLTIDRIDNDGDYTPENCRWVTCIEQANNRRSTRLISHNGEIHSVTEWARIYHLPAHVLFQRLKKTSFEEAISVPYHAYKVKSKEH